MEKLARYSWMLYTVLAGPAVFVGLGITLTAVFWLIAGPEEFGVDEELPTPLSFRILFFGSILSFSLAWIFGIGFAWRWNDTWKQSMPFLFNLIGSATVLGFLWTEFRVEGISLVIGWFLGLVALSLLGWIAALATPIEPTAAADSSGITGS